MLKSDRNGSQISSERSRLIGGVKRNRGFIIESDDDDFENFSPSKSSNVSAENTFTSSKPQSANKSNGISAKSGFSKHTSSQNNVTSSSPSSWTCATCTFSNDESRFDCDMCGAMKPMDDAKTWICSSCTLVNEKFRRICMACGKSNLAKEPLNQPLVASSSAAIKPALSSSSSYKTLPPSLSTNHWTSFSSSATGSKIRGPSPCNLDSTDDESHRSNHHAKESTISSKASNIVDLVDEDEDFIGSDEEEDEDGDGSEGDSFEERDDEDSGGEWSGSDRIESYSDEEAIDAAPSSSLLHQRSRVKSAAESEINMPSIQTAQPSTAFLNPSFPHLSQHFRSVADVNRSGMSSLNFQDFVLKSIPAHDLKANYEKRRRKRSEMKEKETTKRAKASSKRKWPKFAKRKK